MDAEPVPARYFPLILPGTRLNPTSKGRNRFKKSMCGDKS